MESIIETSGRSKRAESSGRRGRGSRWFLGLTLGGVVLAAAACGSSGATSTTSTKAAHTANTAVAMVSSASAGTLGTILVDPSGRTLYRYAPDGTGTPTCTGGCAAVWPPLTVPAGTTHVIGSGGVTTSMLGTVARPGGGLQVTFGGMPLYRFTGDTKAEDTKGQGLDGIWFVVPASASTPATTTTAAPTTSAPSPTTTPATAPAAPANRSTGGTMAPATSPSSPPVTSPPATAPPTTAPPATSPPTTSGGGYGY